MTAGNPSVSAYVPCYNAERYLAATLQALLKQTFPIAEIIVVDDGSTDSTAQIARQFPVRLVQHDGNKGLAAARNTALRNAQNEFLASVDADVVPSPTWLEELLVTFTDSRIAGAGGVCIEQFQETAADRWRGLHLVQDLGGEDLTIGPSVNQGLSGFATVFRKAALEEIGGYNELYRTNWEDWDISVRLRAAGYTLIYHTPAIAYHMRRDTVRSVVLTAWRWVFWIRYHDKSYDHLLLKLLQNFRRTWNKAWQHITMLDIALLQVDLLYLVSFCYWDLRYFLTKDVVTSLPLDVTRSVSNEELDL